MDTLMVNKRECVHLTFVPQNSQDFGFTGHPYVLNDSTYAVQKCTMNLPKKDRSKLRQPYGTSCNNTSNSLTETGYWRMMT